MICSQLVMNLNIIHNKQSEVLGHLALFVVLFAISIIFYLTFFL